MTDAKPVRHPWTVERSCMSSALGPTHRHLFVRKPDHSGGATVDELQAELDRLATREAELEGLLAECAAKLEGCAIASGTDPEFAAIAVAKYRAALAKAGVS